MVPRDFPEVGTGRGSEAEELRSRHFTPLPFQLQYSGKDKTHVGFFVCLFVWDHPKGRGRSTTDLKSDKVSADKTLGLHGTCVLFTE